MADYNSPAYYITIRVSGNDPIGVYSDGISLQYNDKLNDIGSMMWTVPEGHPALDILTDDMVADVFYRYAGIWYLNFSGVYKAKTLTTDANNNVYHVLQFPHVNHVLSRSIVAYPAGIDRGSQFTNDQIGNIMVDIINNNVFELNPAPAGRLVPAVSSAVTLIENLPKITPVLANYECEFRPVLEVLQELSRLADVEFKAHSRPDGKVLVSTAHGFNQGFFGRDLTDRVILDISLGNIANASLSQDRANEKTVGIVGGSGSGTSRNTAVVNGANQATPHNHEIFLDNREVSDLTELAEFGETQMAFAEALTVIDVDVAQSSGWAYARDYALGDTIKIRFNGETAIRRISDTYVSFNQDGSVKVKIGLIEYA